MAQQLSLSFELICLLDWLIKNKKEQLAELISQAVDSDFTTALNEEIDDAQLLERLYNGVIDFVSFFEETLVGKACNTSSRWYSKTRAALRGSA